MKVKRHLLELFTLLVVAAGLVWKFWPSEKSVSLSAITASESPTVKATTAPRLVSKPAVEAPAIPSAKVSPTPDSLSVAHNGYSLYDASKTRSTLSNIAGSTDEDYNAIVKGSPGLVKLDRQMAEDAAATQASTMIDPSAVPPMVVTELGDIPFSENEPVIKTLASGDEVRLTLGTTIVNFDGDVLKLKNVEADITNPEAKEGVLATHFTTVEARTGQPVVIKSISTGNEIHFIPEFTDPAVASP